VNEGAWPVALSGLLTGLVRPSMATAPMHLMRAHVAGTGKSYLVDTCSVIATGQRCPVIVAPKSEEADSYAAPVAGSRNAMSSRSPGRRQVLLRKRTPQLGIVDHPCGGVLPGRAFRERNSATGRCFSPPAASPRSLDDARPWALAAAAEAPKIDRGGCAQGAERLA